MPKSTLTEKRYAVCVGINHYSSPLLPPLKYAENDAQAMDDLLSKLGFPSENRLLLLGEAATVEAVNAALSEVILDRPHENDLVLFYFAGHSKPLTLDDQNAGSDTTSHSEVFLTTYDFDLQKIKHSRAFRKQHALGMERLRKDFFEGEGARKRLFIFDSCYSGDFLGPRYRDDINPVQGYIERMLNSTSVGRVALSSCLPIQKAVEDPALGHGRFTYYLLKALAGEAPEALRHDGWLTVSSLFEYVADQLPEDQRPVLSGIQQDTFRLVCYQKLITSKQHGKKFSQENNTTEREKRLYALLADHSSFMHDRLSSFVGRIQELAEIHQLIAEKLHTGGYITITGQAGQGKSSIIAKLVEEYGPENVTHHFIPFNPGPDHQVGVLRNLIAHLILKYNLSDLYVAVESRAALRDYFPKVLAEVAEKGGQEVIFVDGLDQLKEDVDGERDLSFLPDNPPVGIVFVLGTRPNDTLRPLKLLKPHNEYQLPNLRRQDFDLILMHRQVQLDSDLADQFYIAMQENALYLDLVAKELAESAENEIIAPTEMIKRIADNPNSIFTLAMARLKRHPRQWRTVIKPVLGVLLAAFEPLATRHIRQILDVEDDDLREGIERLGGLIAKDGQQRCSLFHLKLQEYLREDENHPDKEYIFAVDEEQNWHKKLAEWCAQEDIAIIWQDVKSSPVEQARREYARRYYITHLYRAKERPKLFAVLDMEAYGHSKVRYDPSTRSYVQELNLGRQAACEEAMEYGLQYLPQLWRYTLLRCSLTSRADRYPVEAFEALMLLQREAEAVGLAELLTELDSKARVLFLIAKHLMMLPGREQETFQFLIRSREVARSLAENERIRMLIEISRELARMQHWERAEEVARSIEISGERTLALSNLVIALSEAQKWDYAEEVAYSIKENEGRLSVLRGLALALMEAQQWERVEVIARSIEARDERDGMLSELVRGLIGIQDWERAEVIARSIEARDERDGMLSELGIEFAKAQQWDQAEKVIRAIEKQEIHDRALNGLSFELIEAQQWSRAEKVIRSIETREERALALNELTSALIKNQSWQWAEAVAKTIEEHDEQDKVFYSLALALIEARRWEQAEEVASLIREVEKRVKVLEASALALTRARQWERVEEVVLLIQDHKLQTHLMSEFALALAREQRWEQAEAVALSIKENRTKTHVLYALVNEFSRRQEWRRANAIWEKAEAMVEYADKEERIRALCNLGVASARAGQGKRAEEIWAKAKTIAYTLDDQEDQASVSLILVSALAKAQEWEQVEAVRQKVEEEDWQSNEEELAKALCELWIALTEARREEQAKRVWDELEKLTQDIDYEVEVGIWCEIGIALARVQEWKQAEEVWKKIRDIVDYIEEQEMRIDLLCKLFLTLAEVRAWAKAKNVWEDITSAVYDIDSQSSLINATDKMNRLIEGIKLKNEDHGDEECDTFLNDLNNVLAQVYERKQEEMKWEMEVNEAYALKENKQRAFAICKSYVTFANIIKKESVDDKISEREYIMQKEIKETILEIEEFGERIKILAEIGTRLIEVEAWELVEEMWKELVTSTNAVENHEKRAWMLLELGVILTEKEEWGLAEEVLKEAVAAANAIEDNQEHARILYALVGALVRGDWQKYAEEVWQKAEETTHSVQHFEERAEALIALGVVLHEVHAQEQAKTVWREVDKAVRTMNGKKKCAQIAVELCIALARALYWSWVEDVWEYAKEVLVSTEISMEEMGSEIDIYEINNTMDRSQALVTLSRVFIEAQEWDLAGEVQRIIDEPQAKAEVLQQLGLALCRAQEWDRAKALWIEIGEVTSLLEEDEEGTQTPIEEVMEQLKHPQQWKRSETMAYSIWEDQARVEVLIELGSQLHKAHQYNHAKRVWSEAEELTRTVRDDWIKAELLRKLGIALAQYQQWKWAATLAYSIQESRAKGEVLIELSLQLYKEQQFNQATKLWDEVRKVIYTIREHSARVEILQRLGMLFSWIGEGKRAENVWNEAEAEINMIQDSWIRDKALGNLINSLIWVQQWKRAENAAYKIGMSTHKAEVLIELGIFLAKAKLWKQAENVWMEAKKLTHTIQNSWSKVTTLIKLGTALAQTGYTEQAKLICTEIAALEQISKDYKNSIDILKELVKILEMVGEYEQMLRLVQKTWLQADTREYAMKSLALGFKLIQFKPEIAFTFYESFTWIDSLLKD